MLHVENSQWMHLQTIFKPADKLVSAVLSCPYRACDWRGQDECSCSHNALRSLEKRDLWGEELIRPTDFSGWEHLAPSRLKMPVAESPSMVCYKFSRLSSVRYFSLTPCWRPHACQEERCQLKLYLFPFLSGHKWLDLRMLMWVSQLSILLMWGHMEDNLIALSKKWKQHSCYIIT